MQRVFKVIFFAAMTAATHPVFAEQSDGPWEKASISLGGFAANLGTDVRIGRPGVGAEIDLEEALGLKESETVFRVDAFYRLGSSRRHRIDFTWFDFTREATRTLSRDINVDGTTYPVGATVDSKFKLAFYNVRYSYSFLQDERVDFAGSVGLHVTDIGLSVHAPAIGTAGDTVTAPLPLIGARLDVALTEKWFMRSSIELMYVEFDNFKGQISDVLIAAEYRAWKHFAIGAGLNAVRMSLSVDDAAGVKFEGTVDSDFVGLLLYGKLLF
jgi:hypothetical protein